LAGFFSKDEILAGAYEGPLGKPLLFWLGTITAGLTAFYMFRGLYMTFWGKSRVEPETGAPPARKQLQDDDPADGARVLFRSRRMGKLAQSLEWHRGLRSLPRPGFRPATEALRNVSPEHVGDSAPGL
jgi:NADH:ubiquinone oxidoreductase subunit 5 (subunit L)/multisubunit Na+/H+ antiporter MnhA subunit